MGIQQVHSNDSIDDALNMFEQRIIKTTIRTLQYIGEKALVIARSTQSYKDQTGNLRSSIGYKVAYNGRVVAGSTFDIVNNGAEGAMAGSQLADSESIKRSLGNKFCLVLVAGMKYAYHVETGHTAPNGTYIRPRDVISSSEVKARQLANQLLSK